MLYRVFAIALILTTASIAFYASATQKDAPEAKVEKLDKALEPGEPPITLPDEIEVDIEDRPFVIIPAKTKGKVKWIVHADGSDKVPLAAEAFSPGGIPILIVATPKVGFVLVTAVSAIKDEPFFAQTRVRSRGGEKVEPPSKAPITPGQKLNVNIVYDVDKITPELRTILDGVMAKQLILEGHTFYHYDYRSADAVRRKLTDIVTRPGNGGVPALIILDKEGRILPDGKPIPVPATGEKLVDLVRKVAG